MKDVGVIDNPDSHGETHGSGIFHGVVLAITDIKVIMLMYVVFSSILCRLDCLQPWIGSCTSPIWLDCPSPPTW